MKNKNNKITVSRTLSLYILTRMMFSIISISIRSYRNPLKAFKVLIQLSRRKKIIQGIEGLPKVFKNGKRYFYELNQPGWPSFAFNRFFENEMNQTLSFDKNKHKIQNVVFAITSKCQFKCRHCFEWDRLDINEHLKRSDLLKVLKQIQNLGASVIQISGGEPMERFEDACKLAEEANAGTDYWMLTSGIGLTDYKARILKQSGYTGVNISLDHWNDELHNKFRGIKDSYYWAINAAGNAHRAGLMVALSLCATQEFTTKINLYKYLSLATKLNASFIQILEPRSVGRYAGKDISLTSFQQHIIESFYYQVNNNNKYRYCPAIIYHGSYQRSHGCLGAANRYFYIDSQGNMHACPFCQDSAGNIMNNSIEKLIAQVKDSGCHLYKSYTD